ncbi:MAG: DNA-binding protein, partial [Candidatus Methanomethylophilaceae archaeon]|nr:DNA-binding protein [Candidatus Methanomethylophilaceae archaeon]
PSCGKKMESIGKGQGYRCRRCHTKTKDAVYAKNIRWILPGWYEPPTCARRHLSKPLKRMGLEQPCEFVNRRNQ